MEKLGDRQLRCVQENRTKRLREASAQQAGDIARTVLASGRLTGPAWRRRLVAVLEEYGDPELMHCASIVDVRKGVLRLHVTEPAIMYNIRLRWERRLLGLLQTHLPDAGIHVVRFTTGGAR